jgi:hypothetical protein
MSKEKENESKDLAVAGQTEVDVFAGLGDLDEFATGDGPIVGLEVLDPSDMKMPKIKLVQSTSLEAAKGLAKPGQFYNAVTKKAYDELHCILLTLGKSRVKWPEKFKRGDDPLCRSTDGQNRGNSGCGTHALCSKCSYSSWDNLPDGQNKPSCNMSYVWLAVDPEGNPFRITMSGMSVSPTKNFLNVIAPKRRPPFVYKMKISSKQQENEQGVFFTAEYTIEGIIKKEEFKNLEDLSVGLRSLFMSAIERDIVDVDPEESTPEVNTANGALF